MVQCPKCGNLVKRAMNRPPQQADCRGRQGKGPDCQDTKCAFHMHQRFCGGDYTKVMHRCASPALFLSLCLWVMLFNLSFCSRFRVVPAVVSVKLAKVRCLLHQTSLLHKLVCCIPLIQDVVILDSNCTCSQPESQAHALSALTRLCNSNMHIFWCLKGSCKV